MRENESYACSPPLIWVGGKRQLITELKGLMPKNYNKYIEPFFGGGALFFELKPRNAIINDYNKELINFYKVVRDNPEELINDVCKHKNEPDYYYKIRALDRDEKAFNKLTSIEKASRFVYLNKTGFSGLYRVNSKGQFNVPFAGYKKPKPYNPKNIKACSELLKNTKIIKGDFENIKEKVSKGDLVYFDPPYVPLNKTSNFTGYTNKGFDEDMQIRLKKLCDYTTEVGAYFMLSNSYTDFILNLYQRYNIHVVEAKRTINAKGVTKRKVKEVIITNYLSEE